MPSSNLFLCGYEDGVIYDETYGVIYEGIQAKFRTSRESLWP